MNLIYGPVTLVVVVSDLRDVRAEAVSVITTGVEYTINAVCIDHTMLHGTNKY